MTITTRNPGRPEAPLPFRLERPALSALADRLREFRREHGNPTYSAMARRTGYSTTACSQAAGGKDIPSLQVTVAFLLACDPEVSWQIVESISKLRDDAISEARKLGVGGSRKTADEAASETPLEESDDTTKTSGVSKSRGKARPSSRRCLELLRRRKRHLASALVIICAVLTVLAVVLIPRGPQSSGARPPDPAADLFDGLVTWSVPTSRALDGLYRVDLACGDAVSVAIGSRAHLQAATLTVQPDDWAGRSVVGPWALWPSTRADQLMAERGALSNGDVAAMRAEVATAPLDYRDPQVASLTLPAVATLERAGPGSAADCRPMTFRVAVGAPVK